MIVGMTFSEGEWPLAVIIKAIDLPDIIKTGIWKDNKIAALTIGTNLIYDFILRENGQCPIRYRPGYENNSMMWAR